jgi:predicted DNA-binding transcriptional regulator YafY
VCNDYRLRASVAAIEDAFSQLKIPLRFSEGSPNLNASGWLEMAWHLYQWGDAVEVLAPEALRRMVEGHRRSDFEALP